jgi:hypothetical protein
METRSILPLRTKGAVPYFKNVEAEPSSPDFEFEQETIGNVFAAMDELLRTPTLVAGSVMPDACPTGPASIPASIPVGGLVVAEEAIHPGFHSSDICCYSRNTRGKIFRGWPGIICTYVSFYGKMLCGERGVAGR